MSATFVSAGTVAAGGGDVTPGLPSGHTTDDILFLQVETFGQNTIITPTGYTKHGEVTTSGGANSAHTKNALFYKVDGGSESAPTVSDTGDHTEAAMVAIRGVDTADIIDASGSSIFTTNRTAISADGITTIDNDVLVLAFITNGKASTFTSLANSGLVSITEGYQNSTTAGGDGSLMMAYGVMATAGATGAITVTASVSARDAHWVISVTSAASGFTISAESGSYAINGQVANTEHDRKLSALHGAFALNGQQALTTKGFVIPAESGSFTLNGQAAITLHDYLMSAAFGSYAINGQIANTIFTSAGGIVISAEAGLYNINGQNVLTLVDYLLTAEVGNYNINGQNAVTEYARRVQAEFGSYSILGQAALFPRTYVVEASPGLYSLNGQAVNLILFVIPKWVEGTPFAGSPWVEEATAAGSWAKEAAISGGWVEENAP